MHKRRHTLAVATILLALLGQGDPGCDEVAMRAEQGQANERHSRRNREAREQTQELEVQLDRAYKSIEECKEREFDWNCER